MGESFLVESMGQIEAALNQVKKREHKATHHCWAARIGIEDPASKYSDDGEPGGTAGRPILRQIESYQLTNTLVIVTRYYGGTKLGTGGLARAYGDAARSVLEKSGARTTILRDAVRVLFSYMDTSAAMHTIQQFDAVIESSTYHDETELMLAVRRSHVTGLIKEFTQKLRGRGIAILAHKEER